MATPKRPPHSGQPVHVQSDIGVGSPVSGCRGRGLPGVDIKAGKIGLDAHDEPVEGVVVADLPAAGEKLVVTDLGDLVPEKIVAVVIKAVAIREGRVAAEPDTGIATEIETRPGEGGGLGGRRERQQS
jgi:hypothetical protein